VGPLGLEKNSQIKAIPVDLQEVDLQHLLKVENKIILSITIHECPPEFATCKDDR
jgi:hypothetical protein